MCVLHALAVAMAARFCCSPKTKTASTSVCIHWLRATHHHLGAACNYLHPCEELVAHGHCVSPSCRDDHLCPDHIFSALGLCVRGAACPFIHISDSKMRELIAFRLLQYNPYIDIIRLEKLGHDLLPRLNCPWFALGKKRCIPGPACPFRHPGVSQFSLRRMPSAEDNRRALAQWLCMQI